MKTVLTLLLTAALFLPAMAFAQNGGQQDDKAAQQEANQAASVAMTGGTTQPQYTMTGMVSDNGKTFTSGDTSYVVDNPKSLKDHDNQNVTVRFQFNTDRNTLHIISITMP